MQTDLQSIYGEITKGGMQNLNEYKLSAMPFNKMLLTVAERISDTFRYLVIDPMVTNPTSLKDYRDIENILYWSLFSKLVIQISGGIWSKFGCISHKSIK